MISRGSTSVFRIGGLFERLETTINGCGNRSQPYEVCRCESKPRSWRRRREKREKMQEEECGGERRRLVVTRKNEVVCPSTIQRELFAFDEEE